jgi:hypothetical protein
MKPEAVKDFTAGSRVADIKIKAQMKTIDLINTGDG